MLTESQIKHMVDRFLGWRLPKPWNPDAGISYKRPNYAHAPADHDWPTGTNLFGATQAEAMIRHMIEGISPPQEGHYTVVPLNPYQMGNLVDALSQATENGDWWNEILNIVWEAMVAAGLENLTSNSGRTFTRNQIYHRDIRKAPPPAPAPNVKLLEAAKTARAYIALVQRHHFPSSIPCSNTLRDLDEALAASEPPHIAGGSKQ